MESPGRQAAEAEVGPAEVLQLRAQILAFRYLDSDLPVPAEVLAAALGPPDTRAACAHEQAEEQEDPLLDPLLVALRSPLASGDIAAQLDFRAAFLRSRAQERLALLGDLTASDLGTGHLGEGGSLKVQAMSELRALRLVDLQRELKDRIVRMQDPSTAVDRMLTAGAATYTRAATLPAAGAGSLADMSITERLERQQQVDRQIREERDRLRQRASVASLVDHSQAFFRSHASSSRRLSMLGRSVVQFHATQQRDEERRQDRVRRDMVRFLKENNEAEFRALVRSAKNARVSYLLEQTDLFLENLRGKVLEQKQAISTGGLSGSTSQVFGQTTPAGDAATADVAPAEGGTDDFYQIAHSILEPITEQPGILVGGQLKEYQIKGLQWMVSLYNNNLNGILADEMGLGKTIQTISLISYLMEKKNLMGPYLILAPLSTLSNWRLEFDRWLPSANLIVYMGGRDVRRQHHAAIRSGDFHVLLTTYEYVIRDVGILSRPRWSYMIIDEGHRIKSRSSKLNVTLAKHYPAPHRLLLTGTPLQNNLPELWALLNFLLPVVFGSLSSFDEWFNAPFSGHPSAAATGATAGLSSSALAVARGEKLELSEEESLLVIRRLHKILEPFMLRRLKKDVELALPDKVERIVRCGMSGIQQMLYRVMKKSGSLSLNAATSGGDNPDGTPSRPHVYQNLIMQLRKMSNHPFLFDEVIDQIGGLDSPEDPAGTYAERLVRVSGKLDLLDRMLPKLRAAGHKTLIFFQSTSMMDIVEQYLQQRAFQFLRLQGNTKSEERHDAVRLWNAPDSPYFVFMLTTRAGGLGLNLQTSSTVILFESDWNPFADLQAQDRAHRIGQKQEVRVFRLITADSIEEFVLERAQYKLNVDAKVIQAGKFDQKSSHRDRDSMLKELLAMDRGEDDDDASLSIIDDEELNEQLARNEAELELYSRIDRERDQDRAASFRNTRRAPLPRLMEVSELPKAVVDNLTRSLTDAPELTPQQKLEKLESTGRGRRRPTAVRTYSEDILSETEYLDAVEQGRDIEEVIEEKLQRLRRRAERSASRLAESGGASDSDLAVPEEPVPAAAVTAAAAGSPPAKVRCDVPLCLFFSPPRRAASLLCVGSRGPLCPRRGGAFR
ncbi:hypothetical protein, variant [Fonticula alba]|uniref:Adenosinetriphosphatase n=1 Tax=Fonticula alba TaxID=691883 RepID=A0A058Z0W6_FONAL|nr:hypothetical protein, variant [Fonticula alba]KCV67781.1 hypothetical protein, variant [Fonticula alba]|eukprot:XP_009497812.1 hypothetical protein, variant [Fonticula alba]